MTVTVMCGCSRQTQPAANVSASGVVEMLPVSTRLAMIAETDQPTSVDGAISSNETFYVDFSAKGQSVAYIAKSGDMMHVVFNGRPSKAHKRVFNLRISPDGRRYVYVAEPGDDRNVLVVDGVGSREYIDAGPPVFSPDSKHVASKAETAEQQFIFVDGKVSQGFKSYNGAPVFDASSKWVVYSEGAEENRQARLVISDTGLTSRKVIEGCGDQLVSASGASRIATVCVYGGKRRVVVFDPALPDKRVEDRGFDAVEHLTFSADGSSLAYLAQKGDKLFLVWDGREEQLPPGTPVADPVIRPDRQGVGVLMGTGDKIFYHQAFMQTKEKEKSYEMLEGLVYSDDGRSHAYAAMKGEKWRIVINGMEGPVFDRVVGPRFTPDGTQVIYRARHEGRRFAVVARADGTDHRRHPDYEMVYPPVFSADGKSVGYGTKEGRELWWKVEKLK